MLHNLIVLVEVERFELSSAIVPYRLSITSKPSHPRVCRHFLTALRLYSEIKRTYMPSILANIISYCYQYAGLLFIRCTFVTSEESNLIPVSSNASGLPDLLSRPCAACHT